MYAVYHGPDGLQAIARAGPPLRRGAGRGAARGRRRGRARHFFDTVLARVPGRAEDVVDAARQTASGCGWSTPTTSASPERAHHARRTLSVCDASASRYDGALDAGRRAARALRRTTHYLTHPVFYTHRSETAMLRYLRRLSDRDFALDRGMIPLGSCTMKLNATTEMEPLAWPEFADLHPFAPAEDAAGYAKLIGQLEQWLAEITGYAAVSVQPNAGSQGELAGLMAIRAYHRRRGDEERDVCLIPSPARTAPTRRRR